MSRRVGIGVIGCGAIADLIHLPAYKETGHAQLLAVCDIDEMRAKSTAKKFGIEAWYTDYEKILERKDVDAVSICTPNFLHCEQAVAAAEAGKHVFVEKPMATTLEECDQMIRSCEGSNVKLMVGHNERFNPTNEKIKEILDEGLIGTVFEIRSHISYGGPYEGWPAVSDWFFDIGKAGGGCLIDVGGHVFDVFRWFVGDVQSVSAFLGSLAKETKVEDNAMVLLTFRRNAIGECDISWTYKGFENSREILGTEGGIFVGAAPSPIAVYTEKKVPKALRGLLHPTFPVSLAEQIAYQKKKISHFIETIMEDKEPFVTGYDGRAALEIVLAAYKSARTGKVVCLPD